MLLRLPDTPRRLCRLNRPAYVHLRVTSGTVRLSPDMETLLAGEGLTVSSTDGLVSLRWEHELLWAAASPGTNSSMEVILP